MKRLIGLAMAVLCTCGFAFAGGTLTLTVSGNQGQMKAEAQEFRYSQSPRDLAGGSAGTLTTATSAAGARSAAGGRAAMRRTNDPVVIVKPLDENSSFFVQAGKPSRLWSSSSNAPSEPAPKSIKR